MDLAKHIFDTGVLLNRVAAKRESIPALQTVWMVSLQDRVIGHYRLVETALVTAHRIRSGPEFADLTWQKVSVGSERQEWTAEVAGTILRLVVEARRVE